MDCTLFTDIFQALAIGLPIIFIVGSLMLLWSEVNKPDKD